MDKLILEATEYFKQIAPLFLFGVIMWVWCKFDKPKPNLRDR